MVDFETDQSLLRELSVDRERFVSEHSASGVGIGVAYETYQNNIFAMARDASRTSVGSMPWLPQLPEAWAQEIFDRIEQEENRYIAGDYEYGTANTEHEIVHVSGNEDNGLYIFTAEHATRPVRRKKNMERAMADVGTGGLVAVLGQDYGRALIAVGNQTRPYLDDPDHKMNQELGPYIPILDGFVAVHGIASGKFTHPQDHTEVQAIIGLGNNPSEFQREFADKLVDAARDLGLKAIVGNETEFMEQKKGSHEIVLNDDGTPKTGKMYAKRENSTTSFVQSRLAAIGKTKPAFQLELTRFLRYFPEDEEERDPVSRTIGVALGFKLITSAINIIGIEDEAKI